MPTVALNSSLFSLGQHSTPPDDDDDRHSRYSHGVHQQAPTPIDVSAGHSQEKNCPEKPHDDTSTIHNDRGTVPSSIAPYPGTSLWYSFHRPSRSILPNTLTLLFPPVNPLITPTSHSQRKSHSLQTPQYDSADIPSGMRSSGTHPPLRLVRIDRSLAGTLNVRPLTDDYPIEITPHQCFSKIRALLCCPSRIAAARSLQGDGAQEFVDLLDQTLVQCHLDEKLQHRCLLLLTKICKARAIIPSSYKLQSEFIRVGSVCFHGGFADVGDGEYRGSPVAIKYLRISVDESDRAFKRLCKEIIAWKHLSHENILALLGVSISTDLYRFRILTKWMSNGDIMRYTKSNPKVNRLRLLFEVASGVAYLHKLGIVHGDLKGANILVNDEGAALLCDFGLMTILIEHSTVPFSVTVASGAGTVRWMSPELLFGTNSTPSLQSDRYALGMVVYEVLTGLRPFHQLNSFAVAVAVREEKRPRKPANAESLGLSDPLWGLVLRCWSKSPTARPTAQELRCHLESAARTWVPPPEYPTASGLERDGGVESASDESNKTGALARTFFLFVLGILRILISPFA